MKHCNRCGELKADEEFAVDRSREDGLKLICSPCNREISKEWYAANKQRKIEEALRYREQHGRNEPAVPVQREKREQKRVQQQADEVLEGVVITRVTTSEEQFMNEQAALLGLRPGEYLRILIRDQRSRIQRGTPEE